MSRPRPKAQAPVNRSQSMRNLRERKRAEGLHEANVWVPKEAIAAIDAEIVAGRFRSTSEAVTAALSQFFSLKEVR